MKQGQKRIKIDDRWIIYDSEVWRLKAGVTENYTGHVSDPLLLGTASSEYQSMKYKSVDAELEALSSDLLQCVWIIYDIFSIPFYFGLLPLSLDVNPFFASKWRAGEPLSDVQPPITESRTSSRPIAIALGPLVIR